MNANIEKEQLKNDQLIEAVASKSNSYCDMYKIQPQHYECIKIESLNFSYRLKKRLLDNGIYLVSDLLKASDDDFREVSGFGNKCFEELHKYLSSILSSSVDEVFCQYTRLIVPQELYAYKKQICEGDFSFADGETLSPYACHVIDKYKNAYFVLGEEMVRFSLEHHSQTISILEMLHDYTKNFQSRSKLKNMLMGIPSCRLNRKFLFALKLFTVNDAIYDYLKGLSNSEEETLNEYFYVNARKIVNKDIPLNNFLKWVCFNIKEDVENFLHVELRNTRALDIISQRAIDKTLEDIGCVMEITRERVRQIEGKAREQFKRWQEMHGFAGKLFLEMSEEYVLFSREISEYIGENGEILVYLMKNVESNTYCYDKFLDAFFIRDTIMPSKIRKYVEDLPDVIHERDLKQIVDIAVVEYCCPEKIVKKLILDTYEKTGAVYHKYRLTLTNIYYHIMSKYYPDGMPIYDSVEIYNLKKLVMNDYGIDIFDKTDRSISSILSHIGLLSGRGIYKICSAKECISASLAESIHDYIETSDAPIFLIGSIFSVFEEELLSEGIDNKYFLQGILKELYDEEWIFSRDYISKSEDYTSFYSSVIMHIKNSSYPVSKEELNGVFPGITDIMISFVSSDSNIINLFGRYMHSNNLKLSDYDVEYLNNLLNKFIDRKSVCHCREIYDYIYIDYPEVLMNNYIDYPFSLYSLLENLFGDYYNFSRPYIAKENTVIERAMDVLIGIIRESECLDIAEIRTFARENKLQITNIREFIDSCNDTHLLISESQIAEIHYIGITDEIVHQLENSILNEIDSTVPIHQLNCIRMLPHINVEWTTWLIYSVLKKWSTKLDVDASDNQFRYAYPVVAPTGKLQVDIISDRSDSYKDSIDMVDDLSNIDSLISEFILDDLEEFNDI